MTEYKLVVVGGKRMQLNRFNYFTTQASDTVNIVVYHCSKYCGLLLMGNGWSSVNSVPASSKVF